MGFPTNHIRQVQDLLGNLQQDELPQRTWDQLCAYLKGVSDALGPDGCEPILNSLRNLRDGTPVGPVRVRGAKTYTLEGTMQVDPRDEPTRAPTVLPELANKTVTLLYSKPTEPAPQKDHSARDADN